MAPTAEQIAATHPDFVDVSHHQGDVDWKAYAKSGRTMAICKLTEGGDFVDNKAAAHRVALGQQGLKCGLYHFARPNGTDMAADAAVEAKNYLGQVGTMGKNEFPILDFETINGLKPADLNAWVDKWCTTVETATGKTPWLYTGNKILHQLDATKLSKYPLWLADYRSADRDHPPDAAPWPSLTAWQYTEKATMPGISSPCDGSYLYGSMPAEAPPMATA